MTQTPPFRVAHVASVASAFPDTLLDRETAAEMIGRLFPRESPSFIHGLVERGGVETRRIVPTIDELLAPSTFTERNERFGKAAVELSARACRAALERASMGANEIDVIIDVSCTGIAIPAVDVALAPLLGLRPDVTRIPVTESGCAAGALGLAVAQRFARTGQRVLVLAVELCSLSYVHEDGSRANLIASVLFGDGAAAAVVVPDGRGPSIIACGSHLIADTSGIMGFHVGTPGLQIFLDRELPSVLLEELPRAQRAFLARHGRTVDDIALHLIHPGGRRVIDAYREMHGLDEHAMRFTREALRRYGNLSSASVLTVLELALAENSAELREAPNSREDPGRHAFLMGVGPGLSLEMLLLNFEG
jgi:alkylresorcinol/alkylpyrone synthase